MSSNLKGADPQAVRANKLDLVERLADDLAHEIKNPLHSMVINLEVLKRRIARSGGSEPDELMRYVGVLGSELERVNQRVELLLRMVRPDRGAEPTSLAEALEELLELLELERERHGVGVHYEPAPVPLRAHLPRDAGRQLVLNLLLDSMDLLPPGGVLTLRTEVGGGWVHLHLSGREPPNPAPRGDPAQPGFTVARALAEALGGRLEFRRTANGASAAAFSLVLSLPLVAP